jgi:hypothetical protein
MKTTIYIHFTKFSWQDQGRFEVFSYEIKNNENHAYVGSQEIELNVPDNYDPRAQQIAALEAQKTKAMADYQKSVTEINERISKLQALEYTA